MLWVRVAYSRVFAFTVTEPVRVLVVAVRVFPVDVAAQVVAEQTGVDEVIEARGSNNRVPVGRVAVEKVP